MVDFKRLSTRAKDLVEKRGGSESLKQDAEQLKSIAKGQGSISEKAKAAVSALKEPGGVAGAESPAAERAEPVEKARAEEKVAGEQRGKHKHAGEGQGTRREGKGDGARRRQREGGGGGPAV